MHKATVLLDLVKSYLPLFVSGLRHKALLQNVHNCSEVPLETSASIMNFDTHVLAHDAKEVRKTRRAHNILSWKAEMAGALDSAVDNRQSDNAVTNDIDK